MGCRAKSKLGSAILIRVFDPEQVFYILWGFLVIDHNLATGHFNFLFFLLLFLTFNLPNNLISSHLRYVERSTRGLTPWQNMHLPTVFNQQIKQRMMAQILLMKIV